jgi:YidC/Oxa1 family membrane protein insertase
MDKRLLTMVAIFAASLFAVQTFFKPAPQAVAVPTPPPPVQWELEQRYVLQNGTQQVVFSNLGGSVAEINLRLRSPEDPLSVVRAISADQTVARVSPENDRFPLGKAIYWDAEKGGVSSPQAGQLSGFYPLLRRGLIGPNGSKESLLRPEYYAFSLSKADGPVVQPFKLKELGSSRIVFEWNDGGKRITRTYVLGQAPLAAPYLFRARIDTAGEIGPLWVSTGVPEVEAIGGSPDPMLQYAMNGSGDVKAEKLDLPKDQVLLSSVYPGWVSSSNGFFSLMLTPSSEMGPGFRAQRIPATAALSRLLLLPENHGWGLPLTAGQWPADPGEKWAGYRMMLPLSTRPGKTDLALYAGPLDETLLAKADAALTQEREAGNPELVAAKTYYGFFSFVSAPFSKFMWWLMQLFYSVSSNWVVSLLMLTVALRVMTWPLNAWSARGLAKQRALQPKLDELEKMFSNNPQALRLAQAQLYRENGFNPLAPHLVQFIQIPFLIGMLDLLRQAFPLRGVSFIPGWISNLTEPDVLFSWGVNLPILGNGLHVLPLVLGFLMWWQSRVMMSKSSSTPGGAGLTDEQKQTMKSISKMQMGLFPIIITVVLYSAPSGLNLYWLFSSVLGILQQKLANRRQETQSASSKVVPFNNR